MKKIFIVLALTIAAIAIIYLHLPGKGDNMQDLKESLSQANDEIDSHILNAAVLECKIKDLEEKAKLNNAGTENLKSELNESRRVVGVQAEKIKKLESELKVDTVNMTLHECKIEVGKLSAINTENKTLIDKYVNAAKKSDCVISSLETGVELCKKQKGLLALTADEYRKALKVCQEKKSEAYEAEIKRLNGKVRKIKIGCSIAIVGAIVAALAIN